MVICYNYHLHACPASDTEEGAVLSGMTDCWGLNFFCLKCDATAVDPATEKDPIYLSW